MRHMRAHRNELSLTINDLGFRSIVGAELGRRPRKSELVEER